MHTRSVSHTSDSLYRLPSPSVGPPGMAPPIQALLPLPFGWTEHLGASSFVYHCVTELSSLKSSSLSFLFCVSNRLRLSGLDLANILSTQLLPARPTTTTPPRTNPHTRVPSTLSLSLPHSLRPRRPPHPRRKRNRCTKSLSQTLTGSA